MYHAVLSSGVNIINVKDSDWQSNRYFSLHDKVIF